MRKKPITVQKKFNDFVRAVNYWIDILIPYAANTLFIILVLGTVLYQLVNRGVI